VFITDCVPYFYLDDTLTALKISKCPAIKTDEDTYFNTLSYAGDLIILQGSENALKVSVHKLSLISMEYNLKTSNKEEKNGVPWLIDHPY
jgi:hypothetical protein